MHVHLCATISRSVSPIDSTTITVQTVDPLHVRRRQDQESCAARRQTYACLPTFPTPLTATAPYSPLVKYQRPWMKTNNKREHPGAGSEPGACPERSSVRLPICYRGSTSTWTQSPSLPVSPSLRLPSPSPPPSSAEETGRRHRGHTPADVLIALARPPESTELRKPLAATSPPPPVSAYLRRSTSLRPSSPSCAAQL